MSDQLAAFEQMLGTVQDAAEKTFQNAEGGYNSWKPDAGEFDFVGGEPRVSMKSDKSAILLWLPCKEVDGDGNVTSNVYDECVDSGQPVSVGIGKRIYKQAFGDEPESFDEMCRRFLTEWSGVVGTIEISYKPGNEYPRAKFKGLAKLAEA